MKRNIEKIVESMIIGSRWIIIFAVVFGLVSALLMIILGSYNVINAVIYAVKIFTHYAQFEEYEKEIVTKIISAIDSYLIATVLLIFSIGLYELFISKIENEKAGPKTLVIHDLDQLKENLAKVIIIVLIVTFFKFALEMDYEKMLDLFYLSGSILLIALAIFFIRRDKSPPKN